MAYLPGGGIGNIGYYRLVASSPVRAILSVVEGVRKKGCVLNKKNMQTLQCSNKNIYVIENLLSYEQCDWWMQKQFKNPYYLNKLFKSEPLAKQLWAQIQEKICALEFTDKQGTFIITGIINEVTFTKTNLQLEKHIDTKRDKIKYKMFVYLNQLNFPSREGVRGGHPELVEGVREQGCVFGGTDFYENGEKKLSIPNIKGNAVLFDIDVEHGSQAIPKGETKFVIGCRPIINYIYKRWQNP